MFSMRPLNGWFIGAVVSLGAAALGGPQTRPASQPATAPATQPALAPATRPAVAATTRPSPTTAPAARVQFPPAASVLKRLASPDPHERRKAREMLVQAGEDGRTFIRELIRQADDPEARKNAEAALAQINDDRIVGPSYITLHVKDASPREVFEEVSRQCYAPLPTYPDNLWEQGHWPKLTLDVDHKPFWDVMPDLCRKLGVDFRPFQYGMRIMQTGGMGMQGIMQTQGPFLIVANQITRTQTRQLGGPAAAQSQFGLNLQVYAEPKIVVLRTGGGVNVEQAVDDHGNSLVGNDGPNRGFWGGFSGWGGWTLYAPMHYPEKNPGAKIVKFKAQATFIIQTRSEKFELDNVLNLRQTTKIVNGVAITFKDLKKAGDSYQLHLHVAQANFGGPEWQQLVEGVQTRLQLQDAAGNPFDHRGMSSSGSNDAIEVTLDFAPSPRPDGKSIGEPAKILWDIPTESKPVNVPIEFKNLPLFGGK